MRRIGRLLVVMVIAVLLSLPAAQIAQGTPSGSSGSLSRSTGTVQLDQPTATPNPTAPLGPKLEPEQQPSNKSKQKLAIGVLTAILLAVVIFGRGTRRKRKKKSDSATSK
jgi:hypothetical protein